MIELLKSGKINNRLLCEIASHERFSRFMADMEIYAGGIAAMQIQSLNSVVDMARIEIEERCHPTENDRYMQTLQAAHIDEDSYFAQLIHYIIPKCFSASIIAVSFSGGHCGCFASSVFGLL